MNLHSSFPYSLLKYGLPFDYPKLRHSAQADVVILGGGISSALLAYHLAAGNMNCLVVDKRTIGLGSTCASTSLLQYELDVPLFKLIQKRGEQNAVRAYELSANSLLELKEIADQIGCWEYEFKDSLYFAARPSHVRFLKKEFAARKKYGFRVEWLEEADVKKSFGFSAPAAILSHHAAQTNAYLLTHALFQYALKKGMHVYDDTNIVRIEHEEKKVILKTEDGLSIEAKKLIYATGYEVVEFIDKKIVQLHSTYAIGSAVFKGSTAWTNDALIWNTNDPYLYLRTTPDRRIMIGGRDEPFINPKRRDRLLPKKIQQLAGDFKKLFPDVQLEIEFGWSGTFGTTKDGLPFIGSYKKLPNGFFSLGFGGNGITFSQVGAKIISDLLSGRKNQDATIFSFNRL